DRLRVSSALPEGRGPLPAGGANRYRGGRGPPSSLLVGRTVTLLEVDNLVKHFPVKGGFFTGGGVVRAVDGVSFRIEAGRTVGVVGESGCGKTTTAKVVLGLETPISVTIRYEGSDLQMLYSARMRPDLCHIHACLQV